MRVSSSRWLIGIGAAIAVVAVGSLIASLVGGAGAAREFPESEPEGVVQRFLEAAQARDGVAMRSYLNSGLQEGCSAEHLRESVLWYTDRDDDRSILLKGSTTLSDGSVEVEALITEVRVSPPFGVSENRHTVRFRLVQEDGAWRFSEVPWPVNWCPELRPGVQGKGLPRPAATPVIID